MFGRFFLEIYIALRYLRGHSRTQIFNLGTRLSLIFMALMVLVMVLVLCVFTGFQHQMHTVLWNSGNHIVIRHQSMPSLRDPAAILESLGRSEQLRQYTRSIYPGIQLNALLEFRNQFEGKSLRAVPVSDAELAQAQLKDFPRLVHYKQEYLDRLNKGNYVLVGREMARYYHWRLGDRIRLILPGGGVISRGVQVRQAEFVIAGFVRTGFYEFDLGIIYMSLSTAQRLLGMSGQASEIIVQLNQLGNLDKVEGLVRDYLPDPKYRYQISTIRRERSNFLAALQLEKTLMMTILSLLILAGVAGIWVTVQLLVQAKSRSIGMLRAMGLPASSIIMVFTAHSMLIGFLATAIGGSLGIFLANRLEAIIQLIELAINQSCLLLSGDCQSVSLIPRNIYYFDRLPVQADLNVIFGVALATMILSGLAGYFPSRQAARLDPVQTIRAE
ncbi:MAG: ABC transporter permease [Leptospiraceae bacterium]|nr:ABC transporter permease [Leptospiraceae bacterium]